MSWSLLAGPLIDIGLETLGKLVGGKSGHVVEKVGRDIADVLGVATPEEAVEQIRTGTGAIETLKHLEAASAETYLKLAMAELELAQQLAVSESERDFFAWGWRPALSWLLIAILVNQFLIGAYLWAMFNIDVRSPFEHVLGVTVSWLTIYGGGHTAKAIFGNRLQSAG